ncbi:MULTISPECIES: hypothetical protein [unclassified Nocardioides]|nr:MULTISPECIES: hypothetical protein [unclassified Nocardioides]
MTTHDDHPVAERTDLTAPFSAPLPLIRRRAVDHCHVRSALCRLP